MGIWLSFAGGTTISPRLPMLGNWEQCQPLWVYWSTLASPTSPTSYYSHGALLWWPGPPPTAGPKKGDHHQQHHPQRQVQQTSLQTFQLVSFEEKKKAAQQQADKPIWHPIDHIYSLDKFWSSELPIFVMRYASIFLSQVIIISNTSKRFLKARRDYLRDPRIEAEQDFWAPIALWLQYEIVWIYLFNFGNVNISTTLVGCDFHVTYHANKPKPWWSLISHLTWPSFILQHVSGSEQLLAHKWVKRGDGGMTCYRCVWRIVILPLGHHHTMHKIKRFWWKYDFSPWTFFQPLMVQRRLSS